MREVEGHTELERDEARQATETPPTQVVLGLSLSAVIFAFMLLAAYWWWF
ncbi:MAG: hypothetical protein U1E15_00380 [Hyphomicrobiales bacterium]